MMQPNLRKRNWKVLTLDDTQHNRKRTRNMFHTFQVNNFLPICEVVRRMVDDDRTHTVLVSLADYQAIPIAFRTQISQNILNAMANPPSNEVRWVLTAIQYRRIRTLDSAIVPQTMIDEGMLVDHTQFLNRLTALENSVNQINANINLLLQAKGLLPQAVPPAVPAPVALPDAGEAEEE